jgi:hypothetical protein
MSHDKGRGMAILEFTRSSMNFDGDFVREMWVH